MNTPPRSLTPYGQQLWAAADLCVSGPNPQSEDSAEDYYKAHAAFKDLCRPARMLGMLNTYAALNPHPAEPAMAPEQQANRIQRLEKLLLTAYGFLDVLDGLHAPGLNLDFKDVFSPEDQQRLRALKAEVHGIKLAGAATPGMFERIKAFAASKEYGDTKVCGLCGHIHAHDTGCAGSSNC
jgi:hypothetical protein